MNVWNTAHASSTVAGDGGIDSEHTYVATTSRYMTGDWGVGIIPATTSTCTYTDRKSKSSLEKPNFPIGELLIFNQLRRPTRDESKR